jgi:hypothetical protein
MEFAPEQGTCRWPVETEETGEVIECELGTVAARDTVTVTVTETWDVRHCNYSASWPAQVRSPLNWFRRGDTVYGSEWVRGEEPVEAEAVCQPEPEPTPEPEP